MAITIRPSSLALFAACPASYATSIGNPSIGSNETQEGLALEDGVAAAFEGRPWSVEVLETKYNVEFQDRGETKEAIEWAAKWLKDNAPNAKYQVRMSTGTADFASDAVDGSIPHVVDCKKLVLGGDGPSNRPQLWAYAVQLDDRQEVGGSVRATVLYPYQRRADTETFTPAQLQSFREAIRDIEATSEAQIDLPIERRSYVPGGHCQYCRGAIDCPAQAVRRRSALALMESVKGGHVLIDQASLTEAYPAIMALQRSIEDDFKPLALRVVQAAGGEIVGDTDRLKVQTNTVSSKPSFEDVATWLRSVGKDALLDEMTVALADKWQKRQSNPFLRSYPVKKPKTAKVAVTQGEST